MNTMRQHGLIGRHRGNEILSVYRIAHEMPHRARSMHRALTFQVETHLAILICYMLRASIVFVPG
jgi:hypothetical protein